LRTLLVDQQSEVLEYLGDFVHLHRMKGEDQKKEVVPCSLALMPSKLERAAGWWRAAPCD
jgi:hypothetical protein